MPAEKSKVVNLTTELSKPIKSTVADLHYEKLQQLLALNHSSQYPASKLRLSVCGKTNGICIQEMLR
jgi:hypothetical protein